MNLLKPRIKFPVTKDKFYSIFLGKYDSETDKCVKTENNLITEDSCLMNNDLLRYLCSGYISYFRGGNPNAYPYKRIINLHHIMGPYQKTEYISALQSDMNKVKRFPNKLTDFNFIFNDKSDENDDKVSGIYITTQQFSNISLPFKKSDSDIINEQILSSNVDNFTTTKKGKKSVTNALIDFRKELSRISSTDILTYIRDKGYSEKFVRITELTELSDGPVFIFSNWLQYGVESLAIILEACGYVRYPLEGEKRYFIWSSESKTMKNGEEIVKKARLDYNSPNNKDGSVLKVILGTRSVMEGVSFKNVKQVHITDPWWNEARIEQIIARGVRFCSHSSLPIEQQIVDVYRHYSVFPLSNEPDPDVLNMMRDNNLKEYKYSEYTIDEIMNQRASKKYLINKEFEMILKEVAYDCELNSNGNILRLEEKIVPTSNNKYQIIFTDTTKLINYVREDIPNEISFEDIFNRKYSYPNDKNLKLKFIEAYQPEGSSFIVPYEDDPKILEGPEINEFLNYRENINCWKSDDNLEKLIIKENNDDINYLITLTDSNNTLENLKVAYLGKTGINQLKYDSSISSQFKNKDELINCLTKLSKSDKINLYF